MKLLLWCALSASLHGAAAEPLPGARAGLPSLGPNFAVAVDQVLDLSYVPKYYLKICRDDDDFFFKKSCHDTLVDVLSLSKELDKNATRVCEGICEDLSFLAGYRCIEPCKKFTLGDAYGRCEADRKILMTYLGTEKTLWGRLGEAVSNLGPDWEPIGLSLLFLIHLGLMALSFNLLISSPRYCVAAIGVNFAAFTVEMCAFYPNETKQMMVLIGFVALFDYYMFEPGKMPDLDVDPVAFFGSCFLRGFYSCIAFFFATALAAFLGLV